MHTCLLLLGAGRPLLDAPCLRIHFSPSRAEITSKHALKDGTCLRHGEENGAEREKEKKRDTEIYTYIEGEIGK